MENDIDLLHDSYFNVADRSNIRGMIIRIMDTGLYIEGIKNKTVNLKNSIELDPTINLGKYVYENNTIDKLEKGANYPTNEYNYFAQIIKNKGKDAPKLNVKELKKAITPKLKKLLSEWISICGIENFYFKNNILELHDKDVIQILKICEDVYKTKIDLEKCNPVKASITIRYDYSINTNEKIVKNYISLYDLIMYDLINLNKNKGRKKHLKICTYCGDNFIGTGKSIYCSDLCRVRYNRLIKKKENKNDTSNQQK